MSRKNSGNDEFRQAYRRKRVSELHRDGLTQREIAAELGVSAKTVCLDLAALREEWLDLVWSKAKFVKRIVEETP